MTVTELASPEGADDIWGLADFVSAEELERHRGYWWLAGSRTLLVQHTDESEVEIRWISDVSILRGGCLMEGRERIIDGRVDTALERAYRGLGGVQA
jgi:hypothetical protein